MSKLWAKKLELLEERDTYLELLEKIKLYDEEYLERKLLEVRAKLDVIEELLEDEEE